MSLSRSGRTVRLVLTALAAAGAALLTVAGPPATAPDAAAAFDAGTAATDNVYIQDTSADDGTEPNNSGLPWWQSPAIKVCPWEETAECASSVDELVIGDSYRVWITLHNPGLPDVGTVELYRTTPGGATIFPDAWFPIDRLANLPVPTGVTRVSLAFHDVPQMEHFCLLVTWNSTADPLIVDSPDNVEHMVRADNSVAQRNVNTVSVKRAGAAVTRPYAIANYQFVPTRTSLIFTSTGTPFQLAGGQIVVDLGPLFNRWRQAGSRGVGIQQIAGTSRLLLVASPARVEEIPLNPGERVTLQFLFAAGASMTVGSTFGLAIEQGLPTPPAPCPIGPAPLPCPPPFRPSVGGVRYTINVVP